MQTHSKLLLTAFTAALVLAAAVSTASARRLEFSNTGIRMVWSSLTFSSEAGGRGVELICPMTIEGTFHSRTISKVSGQLIGFMTRAAVTNASCRFAGGAEAFRILNGREEATNSLPWHVRYDSFTGTLPTITGIRIQMIGFAVLLTTFGVSCLYASTASSPFSGRYEIAAGAVTGYRADETRAISRSAGGILCPASLFFRGTASVTLLGTTTGIRVRLVA